MAVAAVDLVTGNVSRLDPFYTNDTANGYSCIQAYRPSPATYFVVSSDDPVQLLSVDVGSGISTAIALSSQLVFFDMSWSENNGGILYAYAAAPPYSLGDVGIFEVDATTGVVGKNLGLKMTGYAEPRACESGMTMSSGSADPRFYFTVSTDKQHPDEGDQAVVTYDVKQQKVVQQVPWSAKNGSLNAMLSMTLPGASSEAHTRPYLDTGKSSGAAVDKQPFM